jgi:hypothetical protein
MRFISAILVIAVLSIAINGCKKPVQIAPKVQTTPTIKVVEKAKDTLKSKDTLVIVVKAPKTNKGK